MAKYIYLYVTLRSSHLWQLCRLMVYYSYMRYAFVFSSILAIWLALILLALQTDVDALFLACVVLVMTVVLFLIGFKRGR